MQRPPIQLFDSGKGAVVDTVQSILEAKGADIWSIAPDATVYEAIAEMAHREVGALLVMAGGRLVGIVSERDYARKVILQGLSSKEILVSYIMTSPLVAVAPQDTVEECMRVVTTYRVRHLPVLDQGEVKGVISIGDLVKAIISAQGYAIEQLHAYITAEYPGSK